MTRILMLCAIAALTAGVSVAQAAVTEHQRNVAVDTTLIACNGEAVHFTGNADTLVRLTEAGSGRVTIGQHVTMHLSGVGETTGAHYNLNSTVNFHTTQDVESGGTAVFTDRERVVVTAGGGQPNFKFFILVHATTTPNGDNTSTKFDFFPECQE